jgi:hypothetical protein
VDRQLRNIALLTLLLAALTIVAVVSPEHHRSSTNTVILYVAIVAATGSVLALALGSVWFSVAKKDLERLWNARPRRKWAASHDVAETVREVVNMGMGMKMVLQSDAEAQVRAEGVPCIVLRLVPRWLSFAQTRPLRGATVTCSVSRRTRLLEKPTTRPIDVPQVGEPDKFLNAAFGRWPDDWFNAELLAPLPGIYHVQWEIRRADGRTERPHERFHVADHGETHDGTLRQAGRAVVGVYQHYRGKDAT